MVKQTKIVFRSLILLKIKKDEIELYINFKKNLTPLSYKMKYLIQFVEETLAIFINLQHKMESWSNFTKNRKYRTWKT